MSTSPNPAGSFVPKAPRQPLLWAALAFAAGTALSTNIYRPPATWIAAFVVFLAALWTRNRPRHAQIFSLLAFLILPILMAEVRFVRVDGCALAEGSEVGNFRAGPPGESENSGRGARPTLASYCGCTAVV